jgi:RNA ligase
MFPEINHIDDVLTAIKDREEFIVAEKDGYKVVNYMVALQDTFPDRDHPDAGLLRELRGIIFCSETGKILSRRLHKFFNVNERDETNLQNLPWHEEFYVMDKLDGSMITPIKIGDHIRWGTKMGVTEVSMQAEEFVAIRSEYQDLAKFLISINCTPIFEWCSNKQRIVIDHPEDNLVLLHIRENVTGKYWPRNQVERLASFRSIPTVRTWSSIDYTSVELLEHIRNLEDAEGVVIQFKNGDMVKMKSDWYVRIHKAKDKISDDRRILECILENEIDDLLPILSDYDVNRIRELEHNFLDAIAESSEIVMDEIVRIRNDDVSRKYFALTNGFNPAIRSAIFNFWDKQTILKTDVHHFFIELVKKNMSSGLKFETFRNMIGF